MDAEPADPAGALIHVRIAQRQAAEGMSETRQAIAALREESRPLPELPAGLVERHTVTAGAATPAVRGIPRRLPPQATLALYRAAQEALTNAARHAPGYRVEAELAYGAAEIVLTVTDLEPGKPARASDDRVAAGGWPGGAQRPGTGPAGGGGERRGHGGTVRARSAGIRWPIGGCSP